MRRLMEHSIDYAGLFPPANLNLDSAVEEYNTLVAGQHEWIIDRFVCPAGLLGELVGRMPEESTVTVIGRPGEPVNDTQALELVQSKMLAVSAYEVKVPQGEGLPGAVAGVKKLAKDVGLGLEVFLEVGWGEGMVDAMHDAASIYEETGFKARTGGTTADAFPSTEQLAQFISECAALEMPFKFTAGLHDPIRHYDEDLGVYRHGFLNVLVAAALAVTQDLTRREIQEILESDQPNHFHFGVDDIRVGEQWLEAEAVQSFRGVFGGFGSCSILEPIDGLARLGLLNEVDA